MNLVSLLIAPAIVSLSIGDDANDVVRILIALGAAAVIVGRGLRLQAPQHRGRRGEGRGRPRPGLICLRDAFVAAGYTVDGVAGRLGPAATARWPGTRRSRPAGPPAVVTPSTP